MPIENTVGIGENGGNHFLLNHIFSKLPTQSYSCLCTVTLSVLKVCYVMGEQRADVNPFPYSDTF